jgi:hypothetical protein
MNSKGIVMLGMTVGSTIGGYVPMLFGVGIFSFWSLVGTLVGGILGIYLAFKLING